MNFESITTMITSVGFPIAAYCLLFYFTKQEMKSMSDILNELKISIELLKEEIGHHKELKE